MQITIIGAPRSGTGMHVDPLLTHAWVHCCAGLKRWLLLPPHTPPELLAEVSPAPRLSRRRRGRS